MVKFYNNRELAEKFSVNLARWKRWSREFLPPDPLAGQQAGYARQYYIDHAFIIFLGGHLVSELGFSIPETRRILAKTNDWMKVRGFHFDPRGNRKPRQGVDRHVNSYSLHIGVCADRKLIIFARGVIVKRAREYEGHPVIEKIYVDQSIVPPGAVDLAGSITGSRKILLMSDLLEQFRRTLDPDGTFFPGLKKEP